MIPETGSAGVLGSACDKVTVRYTALDALRGLRALAVCLFHFNAQGPIAATSFVRGSWLFVDFFFVLSGFVMALSWGPRLVTRADAGRFALLRLGRIYPLHIVMLLAFLAVELVALLLAPAGLMSRQPFDTAHSFESWLLGASFLHIFGLTPGLSWNHPSWSIAAEFWTYLVFAALILLSGRRAGLALALVAVGSAALLALVSTGGINVTYQFSLWRCLYGFSVGALVWRWTVDGRRPFGGTLLELLVAALVILFVSTAGAAPLNLLAPLVFGLTVHVFAAQSGRLSQLLCAGWAQRLGLWSYSIYMVHAFVQSRFDDLLRIAARLGAPPLSGTRTFAGRSVDVFGVSAASGTMLTLAMLVLVIAVLAFTHRYIELPGQRWAKRRSDRLLRG